MNVDLIGSVAGTLSTIAFIPQVWRIWKTRSARDLSLPMYLIFTSGVALWFVYGLALGAGPDIVCNRLEPPLAGNVRAEESQIRLPAPGCDTSLNVTHSFPS